MATCQWCNLDMLNPETTSCVQKVEFSDGQVMDPVPFYGDGYGCEGDHLLCRDCNVVTGGIHHPGCDDERCPRCGWQLISCGCLGEEDDE